MSNIGEKGRSHILFSRTWKRRYEGIENDDKNIKLSDLEKERDLLSAEILNIKNNIMTMESIKIEILENREKLAALFDKGVIDETGEYIEKYKDI